MMTMTLNNLGLFTYANSLSQVPPGAMLAALNVVIDKPGIAETRRGMDQFGTLLSTPIYKMFAFQNRLLAHHSNSLAYDSDGNGTWVDYAGTFVAPTGERMRSTQANKNFYFTTNNGVYKIDTLTNNPYPAGGIAALDVTASATGSSGFLNDTSQCAYRITWVYTDAENNLIEGAPSMAASLSNNSGHAVNASVTFTVPQGVTTAFSYRVYRTPQTGSLSIPPGDTFQLAFVGQPTGGQISALSVTITDVTPDLLLGLTLYTSPGQQGEFQTNNPPPLCKDLCTFLGMTFYFNCSTLQSFYTALISVGSPNGIQVGDTFTIVLNNGGGPTLTYTGASSNNFASQQFKVDTSGTVATNIDATARNLVAAINQDPTNSKVYAYYISGFTELPGQIVLQNRNLFDIAFLPNCSRTGVFSNITDGTTPSTNNTVKNGVYVSKVSQPEAVPTVNLIFVGSGDQDIFRGYALRDAVIVESAGGVFRITGTSPDSLVVTPFDNTVIQFGNETGVPLNNSVYSFTSQGIVSITESGSQIMSRNIEGDLLQLSTPQLYPSFKSIAFGVSYESDRKYILALASGTSDTVSTLQFVYNWITQAFSTWDFSITAGIVNPATNLLYFAGDDGQVLQERKTYTLTDYVDRHWSVAILSNAGLVITLDSVAHAQVGYFLAQGVGSGSVQLSSEITAVDTVAKTVTVTDLLNWTDDTAGIYQPIDSQITYCPLTCGYPNFIKRFQPVIQFIFSESTFEEATVSFTTDFYTTAESVTLSPNLSGGWGTFPWGTLPWGVAGTPLQLIPTYLTKNTTLGHWLNISVELRQAFQNLSLNGCSGYFDIIAERSR
jgi:hypothetical protein